MASGSDVVAIAKSQIGLSGAERYGGKAGDAWCSYFIRWCAKEAGVPASIIPKKPWCDDLKEFFEEKHLWHLREGYSPQVGDIICFSWSGQEGHVNHVGLVSGVQGGYVHTVEGNSGADRKVHTWKYKLSSDVILGYCNPAYEEKNGKVTVTESTVAVVEDRPVIFQNKQGSLQQVTPQPGKLTVAITADGHTFMPRVLAGARLEWTRAGAPGTFTFEVLPGGESFYEGSRVHAMVGDVVVFYGYVFTKTRDMDGIIKVTAYDQLRYFKNKDYYIYENKSVSDLVRMLCRDYGLVSGEIEKSGVLIPYRVEDNNTLFDLMEYAIDYTEQISGETFVLYDDAGKLTLKRAWECGVLIDASSVREFSYTSSVDGSINRVKAISESGSVREITLVQDVESIGRYGVLQTVLKQKEKDLALARGTLRKHNKKKRRLRVRTRGDIRVRAGCLVGVRLTLGDIVHDGLLSVASVSHVWDGHDHTMELILEGGEFDA